MRISLRPSFLAAGSYAVFGLAAALAQEPEPAPQPPPPAEQAPAEQPPAAPPKPTVLVVEAGTLHPVAGPAIENGVVVIVGDRITAIGKRGEVEIPADATVRSFPTGHVYPGLIDAATDAFTDTALRAEAGVDAGAAVADVLQLRHDRDDELLAAGITTAYVTVRSPGLVRPQGAIVRPKASAFDLWSGRERAAVQLRLTTGPGPTHALQRQQLLQQGDALFEGLEEYKKAAADHKEALAKYEKELDEYLAFHKKKKDEKSGDKKDDAKPAAASTEAPAGPPAGPPEGRRRGNRPPGGGGGGGGEAPRTPGTPPTDAEFEAALATLFAALAEVPREQDPPKQDPPKQDPKPAPAGTTGGATPPGDKPAEPKDEAPKRPAWPKPPAKDPQKDALLAVLAGELALRVEAHRPDEVRGALQLQQKRGIPVLVLEQAYGAAECAPNLAERGVAAVLTDLLPDDLPSAYDALDGQGLPAKLHAAGVPFAIATGSARRAALLPMMAAAAVGRGLAREQALRAITLSAAEILGVAKDTGSLVPGKLADVLVCDRPLFASDSRVLLVLQAGVPGFEAK